MNRRECGARGRNRRRDPANSIQMPTTAGSIICAPHFTDPHSQVVRNDSPQFFVGLGRSEGIKLAPDPADGPVVCQLVRREDVIHLRQVGVDH